jgi:glutathione S-transferase
MAKPLLVIGNCNYSSWSMRPYMALKTAGIAFDLELVRLNTPAFAKTVRKYSKAARVPVLVVNGQAIWDSLAILEYAAELKPSLWPSNKMARAMARSVSAEMHSGFQALRNECPVNIRRVPKAINLSDAALADIKRIDDLWGECRKKYGKSGPFLFGKFSNADAMFAPVASRFQTFDIKISKTGAAYVKSLLATEAYQSWKAMALKEPWVVKEDEVD